VIASGVGALVWCSLDFLASERHYLHPLVPYWNAVVMFSFFLAFALILSAFKNRLDLDDRLAKEIQQGLLPGQFSQLRDYDIFGLWQPARIVSGDYFDVITLNDHLIGFCIGDVIGHGIPAAILMSNLQASVRRTADSTVGPKDLCFRINNFVIDNLGDGKFITFFYGVLDVRHRTFIYSNAGHNPPILSREDGTTLRLTNEGFMLGIQRNVNYQQDTVQLLPRDILLFYIDGATEMNDSQQEEFGEERLINIAASSRSLSSRDICNRALDSVLQFGNNNLQDDITLLTLVIKE
jgi:phosphoserine phosphatase RsbU/P